MPWLSPLTIWFISGVLLTCFVIAAYLKARQRGDEHIRCRRCHHRLTGISPEHTRCPECAALFDHYDKVMPGERYMDRRWLTIALIALAIDIIGFVIPFIVLEIYRASGP